MTIAAAPQVRVHPVGVRVAAALAGALAVALAAQISIPVPGTPVPMTLQPLAVLIAGGLLGPRFGALGMVLYLAMGAAGLPVFTPFGAPGLARLFGPTGGFLLAYPVAAAVVGMLTESGQRTADDGTRAPLAGFRFPMTLLAALAGTAVMFAGGLAQLAILSGPGAALALGATPFLVKDLLNVLVAALLVRRFAATTRALR